VIQEGLAARAGAESFLEGFEEDRVRLEGSDVPTEAKHSDGGIADAGADFQDPLDVTIVQLAKNLRSRRRAARVKISHPEPTSKLVVCEHAPSCTEFEIRAT
jgi:hypothetical protein